MKRMAITAGLMTILSSILIGCDPKPGETPSNLKELNILMVDRTYSPKTVNIAPGTTLRIFLDNAASDESCFQNKDLNVDISVGPGKRETLDWKAPDQIGTYEFRCETKKDQSADDVFKLNVAKTEE